MKSENQKTTKDHPDLSFTSLANNRINSLRNLNFSQKSQELHHHPLSPFQSVNSPVLSAFQAKEAEETSPFGRYEQVAPVPMQNKGSISPFANLSLACPTFPQLTNMSPLNQLQPPITIFGDLSPSYYRSAYIQPIDFSPTIQQIQQKQLTMQENQSPQNLIHHMLMELSPNACCYYPKPQTYQPSSFSGLFGQMQQQQQVPLKHDTYMSAPMKLLSDSEASTTESSPMNIFIPHGCQDSNYEDAQKRLIKQQPMKSTFFSGNEQKPQGSFSPMFINGIASQDFLLQDVQETTPTSLMSPGHREKRIGKYTISERAERILRYKNKLKRWRERHPLSKKFSGRSRVASQKPRVKGRFVKSAELK